jgi:hypothetical protein
MVKCIVCLLSCMLVLSCSPRPPLAQDTGKGKIIVLCGQDKLDAKAEVPLMCNDRLVASLTAGTYCELELLDGQYSLSAGSGDPAQATVPLKVDVALSAGSVKYFELIPQGFGLPGTMTLSAISGAAASTQLSKLKKISAATSGR